MKYILHWLISGVGLIIVANVIRGIEVDGFVAALIAALVYGLLSTTIGFVLKVITIPLAIITLGLFLFVVNALMLRLTAALVPGFRVLGFGPAFFGSILLTIVDWLLRWLLQA
jgi:putative membrane protein